MPGEKKCLGEAEGFREGVWGVWGWGGCTEGNEKEFRGTKGEVACFLPESPRHYLKPTSLNHQVSSKNKPPLLHGEGWEWEQG